MAKEEHAVTPIQLVVEWIEERGYFIPYEDRAMIADETLPLDKFRVGRKSRAYIGKVLWIGVVSDRVYWGDRSYGAWHRIGALSEPDFFEKLSQLFQDFDVRPDADTQHLRFTEFAQYLQAEEFVYDVDYLNTYAAANEV
jgi:hypothetical protein